MYVHCVCTCVWGHVCEHMCVSMHAQRSEEDVRHLSTIPWLSPQASLHYPPVSGCYHTEITATYTATHGFLHVCWDLKTRPHPRTASTLDTPSHLSSSHIYTHEVKKTEPSNMYIESEGISSPHNHEFCHAVPSEDSRWNSAPSSSGWTLKKSRLDNAASSSARKAAAGWKRRPVRLDVSSLFWFPAQFLSE